MNEQMRNSSFDREQVCTHRLDPPQLDSMGERWHPAVRLLVIVGSATSLWAVLIALIR